MTSKSKTETPKTAKPLTNDETRELLERKIKLVSPLCNALLAKIRLVLKDKKELPSVKGNTALFEKAKKVCPKVYAEYLKYAEKVDTWKDEVKKLDVKIRISGAYKNAEIADTLGESKVMDFDME